MLIETDFRENPSGIPDILNEKGVEIEIVTLKTGDYRIGNLWLVERKTATDFVQSLISGRLFSQCSRLKRSGYHALILLEGNPYDTDHKINKNAIKGALLSITTSWQIPLLYTEHKEDTADHLDKLQNQFTQHDFPIRLTNYRSRRKRTQRLRFLQALPKIGSVMADRLLNHFGTLEAVCTADEKSLQQVKGLGKQGASEIKKFLGK